jgi:hypothetical protein
MRLAKERHRNIRFLHDSPGQVMEENRCHNYSRYSNFVKCLFDTGNPSSQSAENHSSPARLSFAITCALAGARKGSSDGALWLPVWGFLEGLRSKSTPPPETSARGCRARGRCAQWHDWDAPLPDNHEIVFW